MIDYYVSGVADGIQGEAAVSRKDEGESASVEQTCHLYRLEWHQWRYSCG